VNTLSYITHLGDTNKNGLDYYFHLNYKQL